VDGDRLQTKEQCNMWSIGQCRFGDKCRRAHDGPDQGVTASRTASSHCISK
jgi:hypothetical protein